MSSGNTDQVELLNGWSLVHLGFWTVVGAVALWRAGERWSFGRVLVLSLAGAYVWEAIEYAIAVLPGLWRLTESAVNRLISDPLMALIGVSVGWFGARWVRRSRRDHRDRFAS